MFAKVKAWVWDDLMFAPHFLLWTVLLGSIPVLYVFVTRMTAAVSKRVPGGTGATSTTGE